jgi:cholesterol transport system auxiliary component
VTRRTLLGVTLPLLLAGCTLFPSTPVVKTRYVLEARRGEVTEAAGGPSLQVRPFSVSPLLDGRLLVFRTGESVREADFYSELWNAPGDMLADVIARWLGDSGLFSVVVPPGTAGTATDLVLEGWIADLSGDWRDAEASKGVVDFRVALLEPGSAGRILWRREFRAQCPVTARTQDALVAAWNECLQETLRRLEEDLRAALPRVASPDPGWQPKIAVPPER